MTNKREIKKTDICFVVLIIALELLFFRNVLNNDALIGDMVDGRLNTFFSGHWYEYFMGREKITDVYHMFYPQQNILAYSDAMLGFGLLCLPLRLLGMSEFLAFKWVVIIGHALGSLALFYYMQSCMKESLPALLTVIAFSYSNQYVLASYHTQLFAVSFFPIVMIFFHRYLMEKNRLPWLILTGLFFCLIFYTSFYVGFFTGLCFGLFVLISAIVYLARDIRYGTAYVLGFIRARWPEWMIAGGFSAMAMLPFVALYLPRMGETGGNPYDRVIYTTYDPTQLIFFTWLPKGDTGFSFTLIGIMAFFTMLLILYFQKKTTPLLWICVLTILVAASLCVHVGEHTMWFIVYNLVPGASAIRAIFRMFFILSLPFAVILGLMADWITDKKLPIAILTILIFAQTFSPTGIISEWTVSSQNKIIEDAWGIPKDCEVFYLHRDYPESEDGSGNNQWGEQIKSQLDAVLIAHSYGAQTVNGYSGSTPKGWDISTTYDRADEKFLEWAKLNYIDDMNLYEYDQTKKLWKRLK